MAGYHCNRPRRFGNPSFLAGNCEALPRSSSQRPTRRLAWCSRVCRDRPRRLHRRGNGAGIRRGAKGCLRRHHRRVDVYLRPDSGKQALATVPGKPLLTPKAKEALDKGLRALKEDKLADADKFLGEVMRLAPGNPEVLYAQGILSLKRSDWRRAQTVLEKATQIDPSSAPAFAALGLALCDQRNYDAAIAPLSKSLQLDPAGAWETRWALAKSYYQREQYPEALNMSQEAFARSNGKAPAVVLLVAQSLTAVGRYEDAAQVLREFLRDHAGTQETATARRWLEQLAANGKIRSN